MASSVARAVTDHFVAGNRFPPKPVLRGLQRVPRWAYLPARVKSVTMCAGNLPLSPTHENGIYTRFTTNPTRLKDEQVDEWNGV